MNIAERSLISNSDNINTTIALEGPVCAGKTSLLYELNKFNWNIIKEYREYIIKAGKVFPKFPPTSDLEAKRNFEMFLDLEKERYSDYIARDGVIRKTVLDRSIFTLVAFEKGTSRLTATNIYHWAIDNLTKLSDQEVIWPDKISYINISNEIAITRASTKNLGTASFLFEENFNQGFRESIYELGLIFNIPIFEINGAETKQLVLQQFLHNTRLI